jgi:hypothetical protein
MKSRFAVRIEKSWSPGEKKIARRAFESAYRRQCQTIVDNAKRMLAADASPTSLWKVHDYLCPESDAGWMKPTITDTRS